MKEVMAIVRQNKVNATKESLADAGFPAFTCRRVLGRGKKSIDLSVLESILESGMLSISPAGESITEATRLIPKRVFTLVVDDRDVQKVVDTLIETNSTGHPGDGKIFVLPLTESYVVRSGEKDADAY